MTKVQSNSNLLRLIQLLSESAWLSPENIERALADSSVQAADVAAFVRFGDPNYTRILVYECPRFQILVLCWRPMQGSPVHAHGSSACGVRVLTGVASETTFVSTAPDAAEVSRRQLVSGQVIATDAHYVHKVANETKEPLVTLHVYAPPLVNVPAER